MRWLISGTRLGNRLCVRAGARPALGLCSVYLYLVRVLGRAGCRRPLCLWAPFAFRSPRRLARRLALRRFATKINRNVSIVQSRPRAARRESDDRMEPGRLHLLGTSSVRPCT